MNMLEQEIIDRFHQLEPDAKKRVLQTLADSTQSSFDYDTWWSEVEVLQSDIRARIGDGETIGTLSLLDELREESS